MSRRDDLLLAASAALEKSRDPFAHSFLVEHAVRADECFDLADDLALGARMVLDTRGQLRRGGLDAQVAANRMASALLLDQPSG